MDASHAPIPQPSPQRDNSRVTFIFAEHADGQDANWTIEQINSVIKKNSGQKIHFVVESTAPEGMPDNFLDLLNSFPNFTSRNGNITVVLDALTGFLPPLIDALRRRYDSLQWQSTLDLTPLFSSPIGLDVGQSLHAGPNDYYDWDDVFRKGLISLANNGINFRVSAETAPFESCVLSLRSNCLLTGARISILYGQTTQALKLYAAGLDCSFEGNDLRDRRLIQQIEEMVKQDPERHIIVSRGISHHKAISVSNWSNGIRVENLCQSGSRYFVDDLVQPEEAKSIAMSGVCPSNVKGRLTRCLLAGELGSTFVVEFGASKEESFLINEMCLTMSDDCAVRWLEAVPNAHFSSHAELMQATLSFLKTESRIQSQLSKIKAIMNRS